MVDFVRSDTDLAALAAFADERGVEISAQDSVQAGMAGYCFSGFCGCMVAPRAD